MTRALVTLFSFRSNVKVELSETPSASRQVLHYELQTDINESLEGMKEKNVQGYVATQARFLPQEHAHK